MYMLMNSLPVLVRHSVMCVISNYSLHNKLYRYSRLSLRVVVQSCGGISY